MKVGGFQLFSVIVNYSRLFSVIISNARQPSLSVSLFSVNLSKFRSFSSANFHFRVLIFELQLTACGVHQEIQLLFNYFFYSYGFMSRSLYNFLLSYFLSVLFYTSKFLIFSCRLIYFVLFSIIFLSSLFFFYHFLLFFFKFLLILSIFPLIISIFILIPSVFLDRIII